MIYYYKKKEEINFNPENVDQTDEKTLHRVSFFKLTLKIEHVTLWYKKRRIEKIITENVQSKKDRRQKWPKL